MLLKRIFTPLTACALIALAATSLAQPQWGQYGKNAQHTTVVTTGIQKLKKILWQTAVDLFPPYSGNDLFIHYGSTLVTKNGTILVTVRTGDNSGQFPPAYDTFRIDGRSRDTGELLWSENTDWSPPPYGWTPPCGSAVGLDNRLWTPGAGGTVYVRSNADAANSPVAQYAFFGLGQYQASPDLFASDVKICSPITLDNAGNAYFGYWVADNSPTGLKGGIARISSDGTGTYVTAEQLTGLTGEQVCFNASPAISNDGTKVYMPLKGPSYYTGQNLRLVELDSTTLSLVNIATPTTPAPSTARFINDSSGTITIGPDGDVFYGSFARGNVGSRGFMIHYSSDLQTQKPSGAFGWDDTASIVPAAAVPSYSGGSSYLILTKYNNYADDGIYGDGKNKIAVLDPNNTEQYTEQYGSHASPPFATGQTYTTMKEVLTVLGVTPNGNTYSDGVPYDGFREWCINDAVIDTLTKCAIINSEDGHCYRWDFTTNKLTDNLPLAPPTGEAYTPTMASADGLAFAVNNAQLCVMWDGAGPSSITYSPNSISAGQSTTATLNLSDFASGPGADIQLGSTNPNIHVPKSIHVPAGSKIATFQVTTDKSNGALNGSIVARRYNVVIFSKFSAAGNLPPTNFSDFQVDNANPFMSHQVTGTVTYSQAVTTNTTLTVTRSDGFVVAVAPPTVNSGQTKATFTMNTALLPSNSPHTTTVTVTDQGKSISKAINIQPIVFLAAPPGGSLRSNQTLNFTISISQPAGSYTIHPAVSSNDPNVQAPTQINFAPGVSSTILQVKTGNVTAKGTATITIGPLSGQTISVQAQYGP